MKKSPGTPKTPNLRAHALVDCTLIALATTAAFWPVVRNQFVNWDDPDVLLKNPQLAAPGVVPWAFSTTLIGHYQPLAWLIWSATKSAFGLSPAAFHGLSLAGHLLNGLLVYLLAHHLARIGGLSPFQSRSVAIVGAFSFALHPLRVEPVAWASAMPYVFSLSMVIITVLAYLDGRLIASLACYAVALLIRASALGLPAVLLLLDFYPLDRRRTGWRRLVVEKAPFAALAIAAAAGEFMSRDATTLQDVGVAARLAMAVSAPFEYLWKTLVPTGLTPLNVLPITPVVEWLPLIGGTVAITIVIIGTWLLRRRSPALIVGWLAYLALLAPVAGLTPTGVQATADRYMYVPGVAVSLLLGVAVARFYASSRYRSFLAIAAAMIVTTLGAVTWRQAQYWNNSIALWTRAVDLDPRNDVAAYNLAIALADAGREDAAIDWYERTLRLVPDHDFARQNLAILQAARAEREGNRLAQAGRLDEAVDQYARALALDNKRLHARSARGILLARRGSFRDAIAELRLAMAGGATDPEVANSLAFALVQTGDDREAAAVLTKAVAAHPNNVNLKRNLDLLSARMRTPKQ